MAKLSARLQNLEKKMTPRDLPGLRLGLWVTDLAQLREKIAYCQEQNAPGAMIELFPCWHGEPNPEATALLVEAGFLEAT